MSTQLNQEQLHYIERECGKVETRPLPDYPGYFITETGVVFCDRRHMPYAKHPIRRLIALNGRFTLKKDGKTVQRNDLPLRLSAFPLQMDTPEEAIRKVAGSVEVRPIAGYPSYYVTDSGHVFSDASGTMRELSGYYRDADTAKRFCLMHDGKRKIVELHRILAQAFPERVRVLKRCKRMDVVPLNGDIHDTRLENLALYRRGWRNRPIAA